MRADARRNRERIVACALELFAEQGPGVGMEDIARGAGLGVGTLYRHFPDRRALVEEIAATALRRYGARLRELTARDGPRWEVFAEVVDDSTEQPFALIKSLAEDGAVPRERTALQDEVDGLLRELVRQVQDEGTMRRDVGPAEIVEILSTTVCRPGARRGDAISRVVLDGLRAFPEDRTPARPPGAQ
ncbi:TetR/AcrR family transcriptional regulator [Actinomadura sp. WMMB 499]|uniref:TetR/AcrR family transcriptional regulator n=1 Tax=Actinomadura sp. WMMB 499 TaxID=1219491 RepID=UPI001248F36B|nr:TetR/AcrR family transcriptional regulator [Actinomadura sp. WMMB 499]QFG22580.1 TetR/AcrR family transcriptional regulator [Actinomadura sp. WMMB 499]